jgi:hypothetical protein
LKLFQEWGGRVKENDEGVNSSMIYSIYCKNFCGCHNVPSPNTTVKKKKKKKKKKTCKKKNLKRIKNK